nr:inositol monophosphatase [Halomicroarcula sp. YJ-61-S]
MADEHLWPALRAARAAGEHLRDRFDPVPASAGSCDGSGTSADISAEAIILDILEGSFPDHNVVSEERSPEFVPRPRWVIDPLDGTTNFHSGVPHFSVSIAYEGTGCPDLGIVYYVPDDRLFVAIEGDGAYVDGRPLELSGPVDLSDAVVVTGFDSLRRDDGGREYFRALVESTRGVRRMGSAAAELAFVAAGSFDVYFERKLDMWDTKAGTLIVTEAGGEVTHIEAVDDVTGEIVVASTPALHSELISFMSRNHVLG